jgi:hypothetical protein
VYMFAATLRTFDIALFVFRKRKDAFKRLVAIFAVELIAGHRHLRKTPEQPDFCFMVYARETPESSQVIITKQDSFRERRQSGIEKLSRPLDTELSVVGQFDTW